MNEKKPERSPAAELEQETAMSEIETGLRSGFNRLDGKEPEKRKPEEQFHNTKRLLRRYRKTAYAVKVSEGDLNLRMELEHGISLSTMEMNAELAGIDLSGTKLESYTKSVVRSKKMLQIIQNALEAVRLDPEGGELNYQILYLNYFSPQKAKNRQEILDELDRRGYPMSVATYHVKLNESIHAIDSILWGYTVQECMEIIRDFLP